jgi:heptose I phosphotransferase
MRGFLKRHWIDESTLGNHALKRLGITAEPGINEANAVGWCQQAGVPTVEVIAAGQRRREATGRIESFFMSQAIEGADEADADCRKRFGSDAPLSCEAVRLRRTIMHSIANVARRFHRAGLVHRDFYWCHFLVRVSNAGEVSTHLIDLQRVMRCPRRSMRWLLKDLGQFRFAAPIESLSRQDINHFYSCYFGHEDGPKTLTLVHRLCCGAIWVRAQLYQWKDTL